MTILDDNFVLKHVALENTSNDFVEKCRRIQSKSHIKLNKKGIKDVGEVILCRNCKVLYLQDNKLTETINLKQFSRLTHLYLQNNCITHLDGFQLLTCLVKLYLGSNMICMVENLENCGALEELHMGAQRLTPTEKLIFDPRTIEGLSESLLLLDVSGNFMTSIKELEDLKNLEILDISGNNLSDINEVAESLQKMPALHNLCCEFNPLCSTRNYKGILIMAVDGLKTFNRTDVTVGMYSFYRTLHGMKVKKEENLRRRKMAEEKKKKIKKEISLGSEDGSFEDQFDNDEDKTFVSMKDIKKIIRELPSGLKKAVNNPQDYAEHIEIINKREFLKK